MLRSLLVLACGALAAGFQGAGLPARSVTADRAASSAVSCEFEIFVRFGAPDRTSSLTCGSVPTCRADAGGATCGKTAGSAMSS